MRFVLPDGSDLDAASYQIAEIESIDGDLADIKLEGTKGKKCSLKYEDGKVYLVVEGVRDAASVLWSGQNSAIWNYALDMNFMDGSDVSYFVENDKVNFTDDASVFNVELQGELPCDTVFVNNTKNYTFSGTGAISGGATLVKSGSGRLTVSTDNTYTGGNRISGGVVSVSSLSNANQAHGNLGAMTTNPLHFVIENGATLMTTAAVQMGSPIRFESEDGGVISNSQDFAMNKPFSGTKMVKRGAGWLKTYASGANLSRMIIAGGTVQNNSGVAAKVVEIQAGSLVDNVGTANEINVPEGKNASWTTANRQTYTNKITGAGRLTVYCATEKGSDWVATRTPLKLNTAGFTGTLVPQATNAADGRFTLDSSAGLADAKMDIPSGIIVQNTGKVYTIGELTGSGSLGGGCTFSNGSSVGANTWKVGSLNTDFTFGGSIAADGTKFEKVGTGVMTMTGTSDFTGTAVISEGTLCLNKSGGTKGMLGKGTLTVADGATLCGVGVLDNSSVIVNEGGMMRPGVKESSISGVLNMNDNKVVINTGGTIRFYIGSRTLYTRLTNVDAMSLRGTLKVGIRDGVTFEEGTEFQLWTSNSTQISALATLELDSLGAGLMWDTSDIESGILRVAKETAIEDVNVDREVSCVVYGIGGIECARFVTSHSKVATRLHAQGLPQGVYVVYMSSDNAEFVEKYIVE